MFLPSWRTAIGSGRTSIGAELCVTSQLPKVAWMDWSQKANVFGHPLLLVFPPWGTSSFTFGWVIPICFCLFLWLNFIIKYNLFLSRGVQTTPSLLFLGNGLDFWWETPWRQADPNLDTFFWSAGMVLCLFLTFSGEMLFSSGWLRPHSLDLRGSDLCSKEISLKLSWSLKGPRILSVQQRFDLTVI